MQSLYLDILLMVNFGMDVISLYLAGGLLHMPRKRLRLALAAIPGALFAVVAVLCLNGSAWYYPAFFLCGAGMVFLAYGTCGGRRGFFLCVLAHLTASVILGGAVSALYDFLDRFIHPDSVATVGKSEYIMLICLLAGGLVSIILRILRSGGNGERVSVQIRAFGREHTVLLLSDSGHMLKDPISGNCVLILAPRALSWLPVNVRNCLLHNAPIQEERLKRCIRMIPAGSISGKTILMGFVPDRVTLPNGRILAAVIAVGQANDYGGTDGIMPPIQIGKERKGA